MKKYILTAALALTLLLLLAACGSDTGAPDDTANPGDTQTTPEDTAGSGSTPDLTTPPADPTPDDAQTPPETPDEKPEDPRPTDPAPDAKPEDTTKPATPPPADTKPADPKPADPTPDTEPEPPQPPEQPDDAGAEDSGAESGGVNLKDFYTATADKYDMPMGTSELTEEEMIDYIYPGLKDVTLKQQALYITMMSLNNGELSLVEVESETDAETVKAIFEKRVQGMIDGGAWYPGPTEIWTNQSRVKVYGNYVLLAVGMDCDSIVSDFEALVK